MDDLSGFNEKLAVLEQLFQVPPLTPQLIEAIKRITPQFNLELSERARVFWQTSQNGACWGEYLALKPLFESMPEPHKILEIGPGMGRSLTFFNKKLNWSHKQLNAYEGNGLATNYTLLGPRFVDSWCGNIEILQQLLAFNHLSTVSIFNAYDILLNELPGPYDLIYSFYGIGFHWSLEYFLSDLLSLMHRQSIAIVIVPEQFQVFPELEKLHYKRVYGQNIWPANRRLNLLIFSKEFLP